jgi:hypothetical protein
MVFHPAAGNWDGTVVNAVAYCLQEQGNSPYGTTELFDTNNPDIVTNNDESSFDSSSGSAVRPGIVRRKTFAI